MREKLDKRLCRKYPSIFRERHMSEQETAMCRGFPGDGWFKIVDELCAKLQFLERVGVFPIAVQIKEKFGLLRVYCRMEYDRKWKSQAQRRLWRDIVADCREAAEIRSSFVCEECGMPGKRRARMNSPIKTLCDDCGKIRAKRRTGGTKE
jgi:hypothetical protein